MSVIQGFTIVVDKTDMQPCSNKALSFYNTRILLQLWPKL